mgnify:FL=1|jgi:hypothetical protein
MSSVEEQILRASKEIIVKFIETGRISPTTFSDNFVEIYETINKVVTQHAPKPPVVGESVDQSTVPEKGRRKKR